jgi:hypothetical protein
MMLATPSAEEITDAHMTPTREDAALLIPFPGKSCAIRVPVFEITAHAFTPGIPRTSLMTRDIAPGIFCAIITDFLQYTL